METPRAYRRENAMKSVLGLTIALGNPTQHYASDHCFKIVSMNRYKTHESEMI
jgi:hypothetical protein